MRGAGNCDDEINVTAKNNIYRYVNGINIQMSQIHIYII